jgi:hypothetical protein
MTRMNWAFVAVALCIASSGCASRAVAGRPSILRNLLDAAESPDEEEASTALFLLAHVSMGEAEGSRLLADLRRTKDPTRRLLFAYVMAARFHFVDYTNKFVELYPEGRQQELVWKLRTNFVAIPSPLEEYLAYEARDNPKALDKLISGIPFADGHDAEFLVETVQAIHSYQPQLVLDALKRANVSPARVRITNDPTHERGVRP